MSEADVVKRDAETATLENGNVTFDLIKENGKWIFYVRRDNYTANTKDTVLSIPDGKQLDTYDQGGKEHFYQMLYLPPNLVTGRKKRRSNVGEEIYACISVGVANGLPLAGESKFFEESINLSASRRDLLLSKM